MKKKILLLIATVLMLSLFACGVNAKGEVELSSANESEFSITDYSVLYCGSNVGLSMSFRNAYKDCDVFFAIYDNSNKLECVRKFSLTAKPEGSSGVKYLDETISGIKDCEGFTYKIFVFNKNNQPMVDVVSGVLNNLTGEYGVLKSIYEDINGPEIEFKAYIFNEKGQFENYLFADKVNINGTICNLSDFRITNIYPDRYLEVNNEFVRIPVDTIQIVAYKTNQDNKITSIFTGDYVSEATSGYLEYEYNRNMMYDGFESSFFDYVVTDNTIVVACSEPRENANIGSSSFRLATSNLFIDGKEYDYDAIGIYDCQYEIMIVYDAHFEVSPENEVMYVTDVYDDITEDGKLFTNISGYVGEELITIKADADTNIYEASSDNSCYQVLEGSMIQYTDEISPNGYMDAVRILADGSVITSVTSDTVVYMGIDYKDDETGFLISGLIDNFYLTSATFVGEHKLTIDNNIKGVLVRKNNNIDIYKGYKITDAETNLTSLPGNTNDDIVMAYCYDGKLLCFMIIDTDKDNGSLPESDPEPIDYGKYGVVSTIYLNTDGANEEIRVMLVNENAEVEEFSFAKRVEINGVYYNSGTLAISGYYPDRYLELGNSLRIAADDIHTVMYKTNMANEIISLTTRENISGYTGGSLKYNSKTNGLYNSGEKTLDSGYITDQTIVISSREPREDASLREGNFKIPANKIFARNKEYNFDGIYNEDGEYEFVVLYEANPVVNPGNEIMYVTAVYSGMTATQKLYKMIRGYVEGELQEIFIDADTYIYEALTGNPCLDNLVGSMVQYTDEVYPGGYMDAIRVISHGSLITSVTSDTVVHMGTNQNDYDTGFLISGSLDRIMSPLAFFYDGQRIRIENHLIGVLATTDNGISIYNDYYTINDAETDKNTYNENDDIVIVYCFDGEFLGFIIVDTDNDTW